MYLDFRNVFVEKKLIAEDGIDPYQQSPKSSRLVPEDYKMSGIISGTGRSF